jgi:hypothetical protein
MYYKVDCVGSVQGLLFPFLLIKADQCSQAFRCKCRHYTQRDVYCRWHHIFRPLSLTFKTWGLRELWKWVYLWRLSFWDNEHLYGNRAFKGRDSSQLFLHELENKMLHLHEMFVWLMTVIEELVQVTNRQCNRLFLLSHAFHCCCPKVTTQTSHSCCRES